MSDDVPPALKQTDVNLAKCASRAAQLQTIKPIIAYWCEYWVVNQILAKGLHNTDGEILEYTTKLMDKLESTKTEYATEDAITDDAVGQAYVEQFAQETLDRAQRVVKANKVTAQTANTFDAAATFFTLVNIWGPANEENMKKIKYAKWNTARIAKAMKEGKDPNESNPKPEDVPKQEETLDPNDPEVQMLASPGSVPGPKPATVQDVPDAELRRDSAGISLPHSPVSAVHPSSALDGPSLPNIPPSAPGPTHFEPQPPAQPGYFDAQSMPRMPSPMSPPIQNPANYPPPNVPPTSQGWVPTPSPPATQSAFSPPPTQYQQPPAPVTGPPTFGQNAQPTPAVVPPPMTTSPNPSYMNMTPSANLGRPAIPQPSAPTMPTYASPPPAQPLPRQASFNTDDMAMAQAQKHAKWAISALNFEDVPTAVRELRKALESLNAS